MSQKSIDNVLKNVILCLKGGQIMAKGKVVKKLSLINNDTGEVVDDMIVLIGSKATEIDRGYVKVFVAFLEDIISNDEIAGKAIRLLLSLLQDLNWDSLEVYVYPYDLAERLNVSKRTIDRWLSVLKDNNILEPTNRRYIYRLKPYSFIKGKMSKV